LAIYGDFLMATDTLHATESDQDRLRRPAGNQSQGTYP
jgi:hypothetical protein